MGFYTEHFTKKEQMVQVKLTKCPKLNKEKSQDDTNANSVIYFFSNNAAL